MPEANLLYYIREDLKGHFDFGYEVRYDAKGTLEYESVIVFGYKESPEVMRNLYHELEDRYEIEFTPKGNFVTYTCRVDGIHCHLSIHGLAESNKDCIYLKLCTNQEKMLAVEAGLLAPHKTKVKEDRH
jgi:hypothetical protein